MESPQKFWRDYFAKKQPTSPAVAAAVLQLYSDKRYDHVIAVIEAALLNGQAQPWMYDVLALTMQLAGRPKADIERALLSRIDFSASDIASTLFSAAYLTRFGAKEQALKLYRQAANLEPTRPEGYILGLRLAREMKDYAAIQWAATGIWQAAWTQDHEQIHREADDAALDAERDLRAAGKKAEADALRDAMAQAHVRDLYVRLRWAGDGDLDLSVEEPLGTIASCQDPQSRGGGIHMHDGYGPDPKNCYEEYVCPVGVPGVYVIRVRCVDGTIVGKRAQLTVIRNQGAKNESTQTFVLKLDQNQAAVRVPVPDGRRRQLAPERRPADGKTSLIELLGPNPPPRQIPWKAIPVAAAPGVAGPRVAAGPATALPGVAGGAPGPGSVPFVGGAASALGPGLAVGYQPVISWIPQGTSLGVAAVVSPDRRYVRISVNPSFTEITDVFTFTFVGGP